MRLWAAVLAVAVVLAGCGGAGADIQIYTSYSEGSGAPPNHYYITHATPTSGTSYATIYGSGSCEGYLTGADKGAVTSFYKESVAECVEVVRIAYEWTPFLSCGYTITAADAGTNYDSYMHFIAPYSWGCNFYGNLTTVTYDSNHTLSGNIGCIDTIDLYIDNEGWLQLIYDYNVTGESEYSFDIGLNGTYKIIFDDAYSFEFTCDGDEVYNCDACLYVYGYTCGVGDVHLYVDDGGWVLNDSVAQSMNLGDYEMVIYSGNDYKLEFYGISQLVDTYLFSCTGSHVPYSYDRCVYPPTPSPYYPMDPIILWEGYDYNIVLIRDEHGNYIENAQVAIYDQTNSTYLQRWTTEPDGYMVLGALFNDSDHNIQILTRTFDGVFTLETTYPANGSAPVGSENITQTNMTIPIHYNIRMHPEDQYGAPLTNVFCGLSEYTPLNPLSFWGYSMYGQQYVPVTNCSGFAMCDLYAEKGGYTNYNVTALNWTSRSAMIKDYRHDVTLQKE